MKVSVEKRPGSEITLRGEVTETNNNTWATVLTIPAAIRGRMRNLQLSFSIAGTGDWTEYRIMRGAVQIWHLWDEGNAGAMASQAVRHLDCAEDLEPGDLIQVHVFGTPSFAVSISAVATLFPPIGDDPFTSDISYPICGLKNVDQGRPDLCRLAALYNLLSYLAYADPHPYGGIPTIPEAF